ncbi:MAG: PAS domain S-box protein [Promethearchaeota archaeon]
MEEPSQRLNSTEEWTKRIFKLIPHPIYIWKQVNNDLILIDYNKAAEDITEGKIKYIVGIKAKEFHKDQPEILEDLNRCIKDKVKISRELNYRFNTTGKEKILNIIYNFVPPDMVLVHTEDISEKRKIEEDLIKSEYEKSVILNGIPELIAFQDKEHNVLWANKAAGDSVNKSAEEIIGSKCYEIWNIRKEPCENCPVHAAFISGKIEYKEMTTSDGKIWNIRGYPVKDDIENIIGAIEVTSEITERKKIEQKLKESEEKYRFFFHNFQGIAYQGRLDFVPIFFHGAVLKITGYTEEEFISGNPRWDKIIYQEDLKKILDEDLYPIRNIPNYLKEREYRIIRKDGEISWVNEFIQNISDENNKPYLLQGEIYDITERKKMEKKLKESEEKFRTMAEQSLIGIIIIQDDRVAYVNQAESNIMEYSPQEMMEWTQEDLFKHIDPDDVSKAINRYHNRQEDKDISPFFNYRIRTKFGKTKIVEIYTKIIELNEKPALLTYVLDVTDKNQAEQKVKESEERYRNIFEKSPNAIVILDFTGKIIECNLATETIFGYSKDELIGQNYLELPFYSENMIKVLKERFQEIKKEVDLKPQELEITRKDGNIATIKTKISYIKIGEQNFFQALIQDITEQKNAEKKLKESEEKYREAYNRSNLYKDIFTHDINNILQNVLSSAGLAKLYSEDPSKKEEFDEVTNIINEQIIRGKVLVSNVQKLSQVEEITIPKFLIEALNILKKAIEYVKENIYYKNINIEMESDQNEYYIIANELLINIFENILFNSIKHNINSIVKILIRITKITKDGTDFIKFEFLDNGIGIPDTMKKTIFSREYKVIEKDKMPSGIGLGLLLVNRILESYNGEIEVIDRIQGDYSKGSNFIILIPEAV